MCNTSAEVSLLDVDTGEIIQLQSSGIIIEENIISFTDEKLTTNRYYNVTVIASNNAGTFTSYAKISE